MRDTTIDLKEIYKISNKDATDILEKWCKSCPISRSKIINQFPEIFYKTLETMQFTRAVQNIRADGTFYVSIRNVSDASSLKEFYESEMKDLLIRITYSSVDQIDGDQNLITKGYLIAYIQNNGNTLDVLPPEDIKIIERTLCRLC